MTAFLATLSVSLELHILQVLSFCVLVKITNLKAKYIESNKSINIEKYINILFL